MNLQRQANFYLGDKYIKSPIYSEKELKERIGVNLSELRHLWVFSAKNCFKEAVNELIHNDVKIDFKKTNQIKEG